MLSHIADVIRHLAGCGCTGRVGCERFPRTGTQTAARAIMENA